MSAINILTLKKHFHNISYKTNAYNSHDIRNNTRDGEWKKNDLLSDSETMLN